MSAEAFRDRSCCGKIGWILRTFSWYLVLLMIGVYVAVAAASHGMAQVKDSVEDILTVLAVQESTRSDVLTTVSAIIGISGILIVLLLAGVVYNILSKYYFTQRRDKVRAGDASDRGWCGCCTANFSRVIYNVTHIVALLNCLWFIALFTASVLLFVVLFLTREVAEAATAAWGIALEAVQTLADGTQEFIENNRDELVSVSTTLKNACNAVPDICVQDVNDAIEKIDSVVTALDERIEAVTSTGEGGCPPKCLDMRLVWFTESEGCVCDPQVITDIQVYAEDGQKAAIGAFIWYAIAVVLLLLTLSKVAMNLEGLTKDFHWQKSVQSIHHQEASSRPVEARHMHEHPAGLVTISHPSDSLK